MVDYDKRRSTRRQGNCGTHPSSAHCRWAFMLYVDKAVFCQLSAPELSQNRLYPPLPTARALSVGDNVALEAKLGRAVGCAASRALGRERGRSSSFPPASKASNCLLGQRGRCARPSSPALRALPQSLYRERSIWLGEERDNKFRHERVNRSGQQRVDGSQHYEHKHYGPNRHPDPIPTR